MTTLGANQASSPINPRVETFTLTSAQDFTLPSTGIRAGQRIVVVNRTTNGSQLTIKSSNGSVIDIIGPGGGTLYALVDNPTTSTDWHLGDVTFSGGVYQASVAVAHGLASPLIVNAYLQALTVANNPYGIQNGLASDLHTFTFPATGWYQLTLSIQMDVTNAVTSSNARLESVGGTATRYNVGADPSDFLSKGELAGEAQTHRTHGVIMPLLKVTAANQTFQAKFNYSITANSSLVTSLWVTIQRVSRL